MIGQVVLLSPLFMLKLKQLIKLDTQSVRVDKAPTQPDTPSIFPLTPTRRTIKCPKQYWGPYILYCYPDVILRIKELNLLQCYGRVDTSPLSNGIWTRFGNIKFRPTIVERNVFINSGKVKALFVAMDIPVEGAQYTMGARTCKT